MLTVEMVDSGARSVIVGLKYERWTIDCVAGVYSTLPVEEYCEPTT